MKKRTALFATMMVTLGAAFMHCGTVEADIFRQPLDPTGIYYIDPYAEFNDAAIGADINSVYIVSINPIEGDNYYLEMIDCAGDTPTFRTTLEPDDYADFTNSTDSINNDIDFITLNYKDAHATWTIGNNFNVIPITPVTDDFSELQKNYSGYYGTIPSGMYYNTETGDFELAVEYVPGSSFPIFIYDNINDEMVARMATVELDSGCNRYSCNNFTIYEFQETNEIELIYDNGDCWFLELVDDGYHSDPEFYENTYEINCGSDTFILDISFDGYDDYGFAAMPYTISYNDRIICSGNAVIWGAIGEKLLSRDFIYSPADNVIVMPMCSPDPLYCTPLY